MDPDRDDLRDVTTPAPAGDDLPSEVHRLRSEVARLEARAAAASTSTRQRSRSVASGITVALTVLGVLLATITVWISNSAFETSQFLSIVDPALGSPEVETALAARLSDETLDALALEDRLAASLEGVQTALGDQLATALDVTPQQRSRLQALPLPELQQLAAPIASGLEARVEARIDQLISSERFEELLVDATAAAHSRAVAVVRGDVDAVPNVVVSGDVVTLDMVPLIAGALAELVDDGLDLVGIDQVPFVDAGTDPEASLARLSTALGFELPPDFGQVPIMSTADLSELQAAARLMDRLVWAIVITALVLALLSLALAADRRRAVVQIGLGTALAVVVALPVIRATAGTLSDASATPAGQDALAVVVDVTIDSLRSSMLVVLVVALVVALIAHALGRPPWLATTTAALRGLDGRRPVPFVARHHDLLVAAVLAVAAIAWWVVGLSLASVIVLPVLVVAALAGLRALRGPTVGTSGGPPPEGPDTTPPAY